MSLEKRESRTVQILNYLMALLAMGGDGVDPRVTAMRAERVVLAGEQGELDARDDSESSGSSIKAG